MRVKTGGGGVEALRTGSGCTGGEGKAATGGVNSLGLTMMREAVGMFL